MKWLLCIILFLTGCSAGQITNTDDLGCFEIHYKIKPLDLYVGSILEETKLAPRIDARTGETYFWLRGDINCYQSNGIFLESFQGAGTVIKTSFLTPSYIWDGAWVRPGLYFRFDNWSLEGGPVYYTYSSSGRLSFWGALITFKIEF